MRAARAAMVAGGCAVIVGAGWTVAPKELPTLELATPTSPDAAPSQSPSSTPSVTPSPTPSEPAPAPSITCEPDDSGDDEDDDKDFSEDDDCAVHTPSPRPSATSQAPAPMPKPQPAEPAPAEPDPAPASSTVDGPVVTNARGEFQARIVVVDGAITDVQAVRAGTQEARSIQINAEAIPELRSRVLQAQTWDVAHVSGASYTSPGFLESVRGALAKAGL